MARLTFSSFAAFVRLPRACARAATIEASNWPTKPGVTLDAFPADLGLLAEAEPVYETLPGWQSSTSDARRWEDLPSNAHAYLRRLEELTGVPIWYVSVGTRRDQIIHVAR